MSDTPMKANNLKINVDEIMEKIRQEVFQRQQHHSEAVPQSNPDDLKDTFHTMKAFDIQKIMSALSSAEAEIEVGVHVTPMEHFRNSLVRKGARFVGKIIIYLARFITAKQRRFNKNVPHIILCCNSSLSSCALQLIIWYYK